MVILFKGSWYGLTSEEVWGYQHLPEHEKVVLPQPGPDDTILLPNSSRFIEDSKQNHGKSWQFESQDFNPLILIHPFFDLPKGLFGSLLAFHVFVFNVFFPQFVVKMEEIPPEV